MKEFCTLVSKSSKDNKIVLSQLVARRKKNHFSNFILEDGIHICSLWWIKTIEIVSNINYCFIDTQIWVSLAQTLMSFFDFGFGAVFFPLLKISTSQFKPALICQLSLLLQDPRWFIHNNYCQFSLKWYIGKLNRFIALYISKFNE